VRGFRLTASGMATPFYPKVQKYLFSKTVSHMLRLGKISDHMWGERGARSQVYGQNDFFCTLSSHIKTK